MFNRRNIDLFLNSLMKAIQSPPFLRLLISDLCYLIVWERLTDYIEMFQTLVWMFLDNQIIVLIHKRCLRVV